MTSHPAYDLDWNLVRSFVAVARSGSLAGGARQLGITHPTVARHIQQLEESLGVALFSRTAKGLVLNDAGQQLEVAAQTMHESAMAFQSTTDVMRNSPLKRLRLSVAELLAELIPRLTKAVFVETANHPAALEVMVTQEQVDLLQRDADIAIRHIRPEQQELVCKKVGTLPMCAVAHRDYIAKHGPLTPESVAAHSFLDGISNDYFRRGAADLGVTIDPDQIVFRSDSMSCQRAAIEAGWGIGALPHWMVKTHPDWVIAYGNGAVTELDVWLVARPEVTDSLALRNVLFALGEQLRDMLSNQQQRAA